MYRNALIIAALALGSTSAFAAADAPSGWTKCAQVGATCTMSGTHATTLGKSGVFAPNVTRTGSFACTLANFPGAPSNASWCSYNPAAASSSSSSSVVASSSSSKSSVASSSVASSSSSKSSVASSSVPASSSSSSSSSVVASSSSSATSSTGAISAACRDLVSNANVNWRESALQTDQEIVKCLSDTLGRPVGYGEKATGGYNPAGGSKLTIINKASSVEQQILNAISNDNFTWIVFDKRDFAAKTEVGMYRNFCSDAAVLSKLGATTAQCIDYKAWCSAKGKGTGLACEDAFFNATSTLNDANLPIRNPMVGSNKTIDGRGANAQFIFSGFKIGSDLTGTPVDTKNNVIFAYNDFRGMGHIEDHNLDPDMIRSTGASRDIWIHKNTFDTTGDSAFDVKVGAQFITMSFNKVVDVIRATLHGSSDSHTIDTQIRTTMHHNLFTTRDAQYDSYGNTARRAPLIRHGQSHMWDNAFFNYPKDVLSIRVGAALLWEDNMFAVNQTHQEKSDVTASLTELAGNLTKDVSGGTYRGDRVFLWFSDATCALNAATKTQLAAASGSVTDMSQNYTTASRSTILAQRRPAGQSLVDYISATAGKTGQQPFNSPLALTQEQVVAQGRVSCQ